MAAVEKCTWAEEAKPMPNQQSADCFICRKHRGDLSLPGGAIYEDEWVYAGHAAIQSGQTAGYLGSLLVEPKRHVAGLAELTDQEAERIGWLVAQVSRALKMAEGAEHVYLFVLGHAVPHLHLWVVPRYPGTPREYWGMRVDEWPQAPRGGPEQIAALCGRIRAYLESKGSSRIR
jgi:diadenosine tetraphosphate (Ap4A) HIT family hydrolase